MSDIKKYMKLLENAELDDGMSTGDEHGYMKDNFRLDPMSGEDRSTIIDAAEYQGIEVIEERDENGYVVLGVPFDSMAAAALRSALENKYNAQYYFVTEEKMNEDEDHDNDMVNIEDEFILPTHWAPALINGDYSGYEDDEIEEIEGFLDDFPIAGYIVADVEDLGFRTYNDATREAGDMSLYKAFKQVPREEATDELYESELKMGVIENERQLKHHIAKNFSSFRKMINKLGPSHKQKVSRIFMDFMKGEVVDLMKVEKLEKEISEQVEEVGDAYDEISKYLEAITNVS